MELGADSTAGRQPGRPFFQRWIAESLDTFVVHTVYSLFEMKSALERAAREERLAGYVVAEFFMEKVQSEHNLALVKATLHFMRFLMCVPLFLAYFNRNMCTILCCPAWI